MATVEKPKASSFVSTIDKVEKNWVHITMLTVPPILMCIGFFVAKPHVYTVLLGLFMYLWSGLGITAGYHRLWSHRAFSASFPVRLFLILGGAAAFEGSAKWWCRNHRAHHRYTDTPKDPYDATKGFWYAHLGWMIYKQNAKNIGYADISDLNRDPMILWQHKFYPFISIFVGIVFPTLLCGLWGDMLGGYFYAAVTRMVFVQHATFFVNSLAHTLGEKNFSDFLTPVDSFVTALLTFGEGYHNYHHEFPQDYRNGIKFYQYDPTKWFIKICNIFGLASNLKWVPDEEIEKAKIQMLQRQVDQEKSKVHDSHPNALPQLTWSEIENQVQQGAHLIVIKGSIYDVKNFVHEHPGGRQTILNYLGKDVTEQFVSGTDSFHPHVHTSYARTYLPLMKIGTLLD